VENWREALLEILTELQHSVIEPTLMA
jgi:hypothetical protein